MSTETIIEPRIVGDRLITTVPPGRWRVVEPLGAGRFRLVGESRSNQGDGLHAREGDSGLGIEG